jgi:PAS domain S-box-containing protein
MSEVDAPFDELVARLEERVAELAERTSGPPDVQPLDLQVLVREMAAGLSESLEELRVATEEMHVQQQEIEALAIHLEEERGRYQTLFDLAPDAYLVTDPRGKILEANGAARQLLVPAHPEGLIGRSLSLYIQPSALGKYYRMLRRSAEGGVFDLETELRPVHGPPVKAWFRAVPSPRTREGGPGMLVVIRDVTEREQARERVEEANKFREALILSVAHDLRSPVSIIAGFVELLDNPAVEVPATTVREMVHEMGPAIRGVKSVIDNLLDVDRAGRDTVRVVRARTAIGPLVTRCVANAGLRDRVEVQVATEVFDIDPGLTERILTNLLVNAQRYSPTGGRIRLDVSQGPEGLLIRVDDEGPGIPDAAKSEVFALYRRLSASGPGAGIGLYLVQRFAQLHGGRAWVEDAPGGGASLNVLLARENLA